MSGKVLTGQDALLAWIKRITQGYDGVNVLNFTTSFKDGLVFCALVHAFYPEEFVYGDLDPNDHLKNLQLSFDIAEKHNVVPLLEAEDIIMLPKPDKMSIITYVSQFYHAFAKESIRATSNQRLNPKAAEYLANKPADSAAGGIASKFENAGSTRTPELQKKPILSDSRNLNTLQTGSPAASGRKWAEDLKRKEEESKKAEEEKKLKLAEAQKKIREDQILRRKQEEEQDRIEKR